MLTKPRLMRAWAEFWTEARLKTADPELVPAAALEGPMNSLQAIASSLQQFTSAPEQVYLDQASNQADALLSQLHPLAPRLDTDEAPDYQGAITRFRRSAGGHLRAVQSQAQAVGARVTHAESVLAEQEAKIQSQDARLDGVVTDYQAQFSDTQAQRQNDFSQALEDAKSQLRTNIEETRATSAETLTEAKREATGRLAELDELLEKAVKTVGAIAGTGLAGGYQIVADAEKRAADIWRLVAALRFSGRSAPQSSPLLMALRPAFTWTPSSPSGRSHCRSRRWPVTPRSSQASIGSRPGSTVRPSFN